MANFDKIFQKYYHPLFLYCLKFVEEEDDALDILQEVFAAVWEKKKYNLEEQYLKSYLFNAVRNGSLNFLKHRQVVRKRLEEEMVLIRNMEQRFFESGEKSLIEKEDLGKIYSAIDSLSGNYREVIRLSRFEGLKNKQISEKLNIPVRTVETRLFRALAKLRQVLSDKQVFVLFHLRYVI